MDIAGPAAARRPLIRTASVFLSCIFLATALHGSNDEDSRLSGIKQLIAEQRWQDAVALAESAPARSTDIDFYYGTALARLGRWNEAGQAFREGMQRSPGDPRFPVELAGVEFKQKKYSNAAAYLRRSLKLTPTDAYANDFLAAVYLLQGNLEAALKVWNRIGKPRIAAVQSEPTPKLSAALLDRSFALAPASTLLLPDLLTSQQRVQGLDIFSASHFELLARPDGAFDVTFRNQERNGWGDGAVGRLLQVFGSLPGQTVTPRIFQLAWARR